MNALLDAPAPAPAGAPREVPNEAPGGAPRPRRGRGLRIAALAAVLAGAAAGSLTAPRWAPPALARLSFFRVRRVEVEGARLAPPAELVARLGVDTAGSVWQDLPPLAERVRRHPMVADAVVERRLPGVLVVRVTERVPVAAAVGPAGVTFYDTAAVALAVPQAAAAGLDVPLVAAPDPALLRALGALRAEAPAAYARVLEARRARGGREELAFVLAPAARDGAAAPDSGRARAAARGRAAVPPADSAPAAPVVVRAALDVTPARFADLAPVERDLARRRVRPLELDLRFRDQVVARLP